MGSWRAVHRPLLPVILSPLCQRRAGRRIPPLWRDLVSRSKEALRYCPRCCPAAQQQPCSQQDQRDADKLHQREGASGKKRAVRVAAEEFDRAASHAIKKGIDREELPGGPFPRALPPSENDQEREYQEFCGGLIELSGVQRDAERRADQVASVRIGEGDSPRERCRLAVAAARGKAAQPADGVA